MNPAGRDDGRPPRIAVVGGGVSGLAAAWYALREADARGLPVAVALCESSRRFGGKIRTEIVETADGRFVVEAGPDALLTRKRWALELARELGLGGRLLPVRAVPAPTRILRRGRAIPVPRGLNLVVPARLGALLASPLLSFPGRLRMALEPFVPARPPAGDESLASFVRRRFGAEALSTLAEPLMAGIHSADPETLSMRAAFPELLSDEEEVGSLVRAGWRRARADRRRRARGGQSFSSRDEAPGAPERAPGAPGLGPFVSFPDGLQELVDALVAHLRARGEIELLSGRPVAAILAGRGLGRPFALRLAGGDLLPADAVIVAAPAHAAARLLEPVAPDAARELAALRHASTGTISFAFRAEDLRQPLGGYGLVVPADEGRDVNALTIASEKFPGRAPEGATLVRAFFGGARSPHVFALPDDELVGRVLAEVASFLEAAAPPLFHRLHRFREAVPQYDVGHLERVARIEARLPRGVWLAGGSYRGAGIPDCVRGAREAAREAVARLAGAHEGATEGTARHREEATGR